MKQKTESSILVEEITIKVNLWQRFVLAKLVLSHNAQGGRARGHWITRRVLMGSDSVQALVKDYLTWWWPQDTYRLDAVIHPLGAYPTEITSQKFILICKSVNWVRSHVHSEGYWWGEFHQIRGTFCQHKGKHHKDESKTTTVIRGYPSDREVVWNSGSNRCRRGWACSKTRRKSTETLRWFARRSTAVFWEQVSTCTGPWRRAPGEVELRGDFVLSVVTQGLNRVHVFAARDFARLRCLPTPVRMCPTNPSDPFLLGARSSLTTWTDTAPIC